MDLDFTKIPQTLEQQTVQLLTEIRDLLKEQNAENPEILAAKRRASAARSRKL